MNQKWVVLGLAALLLLGGLWWLSQSRSPQACFANGACLNLEVADSPTKQAQGLMFRSELNPNSGMIFVFGTSTIHSFWMKNTLIPLDMIFLDGNGTIVGIQANVPPCENDPCPTYSVNAPSYFVIEANAGFAERNNLRANQKVKIENLSS